MNVELSRFTKENIELTFEWIKDEELRNRFLMRGEICRKKHQEYFEHVLNDENQRVYAIFYEGLHIGNCGFKNISFENKLGELWIYIGEKKLRGKGVGKKATELLVKEGFEELDFTKIYLHVADFNIPAINLYKKMGFIETHGSELLEEWKNRDCNIIRMELKRYYENSNDAT